MKDTTGFIVIATEETFEHIFLKSGVFQVDRAERVHLIKETIMNSQHIIEDREHKRRFHYLQPYEINGQGESFCVITKRSGKSNKSVIITAFPVERERILSLLSHMK